MEYPASRKSFTHLSQVDSSISRVWTGPFLIYWFLVVPCCVEIPVFNANIVGPDQTPRSAASDLGLHCLLMSLLWA